MHEKVINGHSCVFLTAFETLSKNSILTKNDQLLFYAGNWYKFSGVDMINFKHRYDIIKDKAEFLELAIKELNQDTPTFGIDTASGLTFAEFIQYKNSQT